MKPLYTYIYYAVLLLIMLLRDSTDAPSIILRVAYISAFFLPLLFLRKAIFPAILTCFMVVGTYGYAFNYLPYEMYAYFIIALLGMAFDKQQYDYNQISIIFILSLAFILFRNILDSVQPQNLFYCLGTVGAFALMSKQNSRETAYHMLYCFVTISLALSLLYLFNYDRFIEDYDGGEGLERAGWIDPNYFSCVIGMGILSSMIIILNSQIKRFWLWILLITTIIVSFVAQVLMASRGGILSVALGLGALVLFSNIKSRYKILILVIVLGFVSIMYTSDLFALLEYRIQNDDGSGSGRLDIWKDKIQAFSSDGNLLTWIFGIGHQSAFTLTGAGGGGVGFHNDFIAIFCAYGISGLTIFIYWFVYPFFKSVKRYRFIVFAMLLYMVVASMTLEPLSYGYFPYFSFFYTIFLIASGALDKKNLLSKSI